MTTEYNIAASVDPVKSMTLQIYRMEEDHSSLRTRKMFPDSKQKSSAVNMDDANSQAIKSNSDISRGNMRGSFVQHCMEFFRCTSLHGLQYVGEKDRPLIDRAEKMQLSALLCDIKIRSTQAEVVGKKVLDFLYQMAPGYGDVFLNHRCMWSGKLKTCSSIFNPLVTDNGICYTFNLLPPSQLFTNDTVQSYVSHWNPEEQLPNWSLQDGYPKEDNITQSYPLRAYSADVLSGIQIPLYMDSNQLDPLCKIPVLGFKVLLHSPAEFPTLQDKYFRVPMDKEIAVGVHPRVMKTSESLRSYSPETRRCFFSNERLLRYFRIYTERNCAHECITNYTLKHCGCVAHFMPRTKDTPVCGPPKIECVLNLKELFSSDEQAHASCNCMPACRELNYDLEISQASIRWTDYFIAINMTPSPGQKVSLMNVYHYDSYIVTSKRSELYGFPDFLASCGGLLGLYLGFGILSLIEILYFCTIRIVTPLISFKCGSKNKEQTCN